MLRPDQHQGIGAHQGDAVGQRIGGNQQTLFVLRFCDLDAPGIDGDILGGGGQPDHQGAAAQYQNAKAHAHKSHGEQAQRHQALRRQHPAAALAQYLQNRNPVHQRRPDELQGIGQANPGQKADSLQAGAFIAQPEAECVCHQQEGQA